MWRRTPPLPTSTPPPPTSPFSFCRKRIKRVCSMGDLLYLDLFNLIPCLHIVHMVFYIGVSCKRIIVMASDQSSWNLEAKMNPSFVVFTLLMPWGWSSDNAASNGVLCWIYPCSCQSTNIDIALRSKEWHTYPSLAWSRGLWSPFVPKLRTNFPSTHRSADQRVLSFQLK